MSDADDRQQQAQDSRPQERKRRNPMAVFNRYDRNDAASRLAIPISSIAAISISRKTGETLIMCRPSGVIVLADSFTDAVAEWKKTTDVVVFHQWGDRAAKLKIPIAVDMATIGSVEPSRVDGGASSIVRTPSGVINVTETFEAAVEIAQG